MRGSAGAPQAAARRSDQAPAQQIAAAALVVPVRWAIEIESPSGDSEPAAHPVTTRPPRRSSSAAKLAATRAKSTTPVSGEWSAAIPVACGSISRSSSGPIRRSPGTSFSRPLRSSSSSAASSPSSVATITLPLLTVGIPCSSQ